jgi:hypothetical protein
MTAPRLPCRSGNGERRFHLPGDEQKSPLGDLFYTY